MDPLSVIDDRSVQSKAFCTSPSLFLLVRLTIEMTLGLGKDREAYWAALLPVLVHKLF